MTPTSRAQKERQPTKRRKLQDARNRKVPGFEFLGVKGFIFWPFRRDATIFCMMNDPITCHANELHYTGREVDTWRDPEPQREPYGTEFHTCSYCGSIAPAELLEHLKKGATVNLADMKHGYPHKFYVEGIPNPQAGKPVNCGTTPDGMKIVEPGPKHTFCKFYTRHLIDAPREVVIEISMFTAKQARLAFTYDKEDKLMYVIFDTAKEVEEYQKDATD